MDLKLVDAGDLSIRIAISNGIGNSGTWFASNTAHSLSLLNLGIWEHARFDFSDLVQVSGSDTLESVLGDILHFPSK